MVYLGYLASNNPYARIFEVSTVNGTDPVEFTPPEGVLAPTDLKYIGRSNDIILQAYVPSATETSQELLVIRSGSRSVLTHLATDRKFHYIGDSSADSGASTIGFAGSASPDEDLSAYLVDLNLPERSFQLRADRRPGETVAGVFILGQPH